jgi:Ca2+-binding RTX toxin-like protein
VTEDITGAIDGTGNADIIVGNGNNSTILAGGGNDIIIGGGGGDTITGGTGADTFVLLATSDSGTTGTSRDTITDFSHIEGDKINVSAIDAIQGGGNNAFTYTDQTGLGATTAAAALTGTGQLVYYLDSATGHYMLAGNTTGSTAPEFTIDLGATNKHLVAGDFVL